MENNFSLSTFAFVFDEKLEHILLIKRNEEKRKKWGFDWGIIGGKIEPGEYSQEAILREIKEEIGIHLDKEELKFLFFEERPSTKHTPAVHFLYGVTLNKNTKITLNEESDEAQWFSLDKLPDKMADSKERIKQATQTYKQKYKQLKIRGQNE